MPDRKQQALRFMYNYWRENGTYPKSSEIAKHLNTKVKQWNTIRGQLVYDGFLEKDTILKFKLAEHVIESFANEDTLRETLFGKFIDIPLLGEVMAGEGDNLAFWDGIDSLRIPAFDNLPPKRELTVWQAKGTSMIHEGINPGDYIITKKVTEIHHGEIVVVYYLPEEEYDHHTPKEDIALAIEDPLNFKGPVVKYYESKPGEQRNNQPTHKLSWRNEKDSHDTITIYSRHLDTARLWRVIAVYAPEKFFFPKDVTKLKPFALNT